MRSLARRDLEDDGLTQDLPRLTIASCSMDTIDLVLILYWYRVSWRTTRSLMHLTSVKVARWRILKQAEEAVKRTTSLSFL